MKTPSDKNKVIYPVQGKPMILRTLTTLKKAKIKSLVVVVGHAAESVKSVLGNSITYAHQKEPNGTGHALKTALPHIPKKTAHVISMYGDDSAFYTPSLMQELIHSHTKNKAKISLLTIIKSDPKDLGRIIRDASGEIIGIVEEANATDRQRFITEVNTGLYCFNRKFLENNIKEIKPNSVNGEYYLTDLVDLAYKKDLKINSILKNGEKIWFGINTQDQLQKAQTYSDIT